MRSAVVAAFLIVAACLAATTASADVRLERGDRVAATIVGLPQLDFEAVVDKDGQINLRWLGRYDVSQTSSLSELERSVRNEARGRIIKQYGRDGDLFILQLEVDDVYLSLAGYRPVVVSGDVRKPGKVEYTPGLTVREAIAIAGGAQSSMLAGLTIADPTQLLRWQSDFGLAALTHAETMVKVWRISVEIGDASEDGAPEPANVRIPEATLAALIAEQRDILAVNRKTEVGERNYFVEASRLAEQRIDILRQQQEKLAASTSEDEAEERRIAELVGRGLAPAGRLADIRRSNVLAATRLLDLEENLAFALFEFARLERQALQYEEERLQTLLTNREAEREALRAARHRMEIIAEYLGSQSSEYLADEIYGVSEMQATVYRMVDGRREEAALALDAELRPGDALDISFAESAGLGQ